MSYSIFNSHAHILSGAAFHVPVLRAVSARQREREVDKKKCLTWEGSILLALVMTSGAYVVLALLTPFQREVVAKVTMTILQLGNRVPSPLGYYCRYVNTEVLEFIELHLSDLKVFYLTNNIYFYKRVALLKRMNSKLDGNPIQLGPTHEITLWNEFRNRNNLQPCWLIVTAINTRKLSVCFVSSGLKIIDKLGLWTLSCVSLAFNQI